MKTVFVSGTFDLLHSGHITFLKEASKYGKLHVGLGNDNSIKLYKGKPPICNEKERLFMINSIKYVFKSWINKGLGQLDWIEEIKELNPDIMIVNEDQHSEAKENLCFDLGIKYIVLKRNTLDGLPVRSTTNYRQYASNDH